MTTPGLDLYLQALRFSLVPRGPLRFGRSGAANDFRGALGSLLPEEWFRPRRTTGPSGLRDAPRPFVLRVSGCEVTVNLFDLTARAMIEDAFQRLASQGIGAGRTQFEIASLACENITLSLSPVQAPPQITVLFLTPTELKEGGLQPARGFSPASLPFYLLAARLRDRISALRAVYGPGPLDLDFKAFAVRARQVSCIGSQLTWAGASRRSTRTGQTHPLSGFTGHATYSGPLNEFLPFLLAGQHTGVGRQTTWGKGELRIASDSAPGAVHEPR